LISSHAASAKAAGAGFFVSPWGKALVIWIFAVSEPEERKGSLACQGANVTFEKAPKVKTQKR